MIPPVIIKRAVEKNIDVIGICDHNSAENVSAVREAAQGYEIVVLGGMEVTSEEEVHILGFLHEEPELEDLQRFIYGHLHGSNDPEAFGHQWVVDPEGGVEDINPRLLIGATDLSVHEVVEAIHQRGGIAIAAHVDRFAYSILSQLGFVPPDLSLEAMEVSPFARDNGFDVSSVEFPVVTFSDAHYVEEIGRAWTGVVVESPCLSEIKKAFKGEDGRSVWRTSLYT